ncbi:putative early protein [Olleya phage Harreka_1]|uniref:Putative early protein n=1 Tax=Olleya phage Harreka_1 TaxID=2745673 RepID=A0A8E4ZJU3_9CAUD|nr:nucleotide kinase [Olleya phage Harreka_1]QQV90436.1 putative early protein [Olleya phage Harreka_1]
MRIKCINKGEYLSLTIGKEYDSVKEDKDFYYITNDDGEKEECYFKKRFEIVKTNNMRPTIEEVRAYFKDALEVRCIYDNKIHKLLNINHKNIGYDFYYTGEYTGLVISNNNYAGLWDEKQGYAEITKYKTKGVKNPEAKHYELWNDFEAIDVIKASLTPEEYKGYLKGSILKYKLREKGQDESDKVKSKDYQNELNHLNK